MKLLTRNEFREAVFKRDGYKCVICGQQGKDAHHILERRLFKEAEEVGGYFLENGSTLCEAHHLLAENTSLSCESIRSACGISQIVLPKHFEKSYSYDKWGNILLENGKKARGELFYEEPVQKVLHPFLHDFEKYVPYPFLLTKKEVGNIFKGEEVVILEVLAGEKQVWYENYIHAQKIEMFIENENWHKIKSLIDENMYLQGIQTEEFRLSFVGIENEFLSWEETKEYANILNIKTFPIFYEGIFKEEIFSNRLYLIRKKTAFSWHDCSKVCCYLS